MTNTGISPSKRQVLNVLSFPADRVARCRPGLSKKQALENKREEASQELSDAELLRLGVQLEQAEQEWLRQCAAVDAGEPIECDSDGVSVPLNFINYGASELIDAILRQKAQTVAGIIVQTRAIVLDKAEWWNGCPEMENPRCFFESLCSFFGIVAGPIQK
jgi:hypothetical protein